MYENIDRTKLPVGTILIDTDEPTEQYRHIRIIKKPVNKIDEHYYVDVISVFSSNWGSLSVDNMGSIDLADEKYVVIWSPEETPKQVEGADFESETQRSQPRG